MTEDSSQLGDPWDDLHTAALESSIRYARGSRGKQMRMRILAAAERMARSGIGTQDPRVEPAALAVELLHLASIVHDDVADDGAVRRGLPSVPAAFGSPAAAAAGGALFGHALELIAGCGDAAVTLATEAAQRMCEGQIHELRSLYNCARTPTEYLEAVAGKSAAMFALASRLGGLVGGADALTMETLVDYGESLGMGHQVIDDIEDIGDLVVAEGQTDRLNGNDLRNGNYTLPVIYALEECPDLATLLRERAPLTTIASRIVETSAIERAAEYAKGCLFKAKMIVWASSESRELVRVADELVEGLNAKLQHQPQS